MKRLSKQPKPLVLALAIALGFAVVGAGCSSGKGNGSDMANPPATPGTTTMPNNNMPNNNNGMANNNATTTPPTTPNLGTAGVADSTHPVSDTWITTKVKAKLNTIDGLDNSDMDVETNNGIVTLTGRVSSQAQLNSVVTAIKSIKGVKNVETSRLKIGPDTNQ